MNLRERVHSHRLVLHDGPAVRLSLPIRCFAIQKMCSSNMLLNFRRTLYECAGSEVHSKKHIDERQEPPQSAAITLPAIQRSSPNNAWRPAELPSGNAGNLW